MEGKKRVYRTTEERVADVEKKIDYHQRCIDQLNIQKQALLNPTRKAREKKPSKKMVDEAIKESGLSPDEILKLIAKATAKKDSAKSKDE